jgi:hypothetical protein
MDLVDFVTVVRCDSHSDVVATRTCRSLRLRRERREPLTAAPLVVPLENAIAYCKGGGRLNQQQRRCSEEQKVFHKILPGLSEDLELATDAVALAIAALTLAICLLLPRLPLNYSLADSGGPGHGREAGDTAAEIG